MSELSSFLEKITKQIPKDINLLSIVEIREIIKEINNFLYCYHDKIGTLHVLDGEYHFFSEFHKFWHNNHQKILNIRINENACEHIADSLHEVFVRTQGKAFYELYDTCNLSKEDTCRVRFLTANQDFRGSRNFKEIATIFNEDKSIFDEAIIFNDPNDFIKSLKIAKLSQTDKRVQFAKNISSFLVDNNITPFDLISFFKNDVLKIKKTITGLNAGYGNKKADMFIRDMVILGVWKNVRNFDKIDVASDVNTIKVALRTGILQTDIPLVSSFLDIFCYQYSHIDHMNALAWRTVWEKWCQKYPEETIESPCLLDYFIYGVVGKQFCKDSLCEFKCEVEQHVFKWHSSRNKNCQVCAKEKRRNKAILLNKKLPCLDSDGRIAIKETEFVLSNVAEPNYDECPFIRICEQYGKHHLSPPKSISIKGQTGWETAYAYKNCGGGGLMA